MRFVIVGAGRVGLRTARVLRDSDHEVVLVEVDPQAVERARAEGFDVVSGDGSTEGALAQADLAAADALGALTGDLNDNFIACMIAKHHGCRTVLRIDEDYREDVYRKYAAEVDEVIYPERLGAIAAKNALLGGSSRAIADVARDLQLVEFTVAEDSPMRGYTLSELELPADSEVLAFGKQGEVYGLPDADASLETGDRLVVLADFSVLDDVRRIVVGAATGRAAATGGA
ncbi:MAG: TrkA family potassium uptake protein [Haloarculaceae archaeon]